MSAPPDADMEEPPPPVAPNPNADVGASLDMLPPPTPPKTGAFGCSDWFPACVDEPNTGLDASTGLKLGPPSPKPANGLLLAAGEGFAPNGLGFFPFALNSSNAGLASASFGAVCAAVVLAGEVPKMLG